MNVASEVRRPSPQIILLLPLLAVLWSGLAHAEAWPTKPVKVIVPISAGGATDVLARTMAQALAQSTGQPFVVENKTGAAGSIGSAEAARAAPDGYTLLVGTTSTHSIAPHVSSNLPYDIFTDFTPIALLAETNNVLLMSPTLPFKSLAELLAAAKAKPGSIYYASSGIGSWGHLSFELFAAQAGVTLTHVPYRGTSAAIADISQGNVQLALDAVVSGVPLVKQGRVKGLAVSGPRRSALAPEIPTMGETVKGFSVQSWFGVYGPKGMSPELTKRINEEIVKVLNTPEMTAKFLSLGTEPSRLTPAEFAAYMKVDSARWGKLIKERNIKLD
ncbi:MAG: tripartite tricarboxylate transporter substrate binding protein [Burkholderiales bacterium]|nr:tripartite tricarboxylate transporter substrate binding protein [Burkholderiales bacterium]